MRKGLVGILVLFCFAGLYSQDKTVRYKTSAIVSPTVNLYRGDVCSGCANVGYGLSVSSRFKINRKFLFRPEFEVQHIQSQSDSETQLSFANNLIGATINFEYGLHRLSKGRSGRAKNEVFLLFAPVVYHHNPYAKFNDEKTNLAPLQTEDVTYSKLIPGLKLGLNFNLLANKKTRIGFQVDYTFLLSDYVDDVSGDYIDYTIVDPQRATAIDPSQTAEIGSERGNDSGFDSIIKASLIWEFSFSRVRKTIR